MEEPNLSLHHSPIRTLVEVAAEILHSARRGADFNIDVTVEAEE